jgi:uncharacterized protein YukE
MSFYGDPDELDRIAGDIEKQAEQVRTRGGELDSRAAGMQWKSVAADRCRETVHGDRKSLDEIAQRMDEAAALLRRHAQEVRELIEKIKRIEDAVVGWFNSAIDRFNHAVDSFKHAVGDVVDSVTGFLGFGGGGSPPEPPTPPWQNWPHQPGNLPPSGDKAWLDVGTFMQGQGVIR